MIIIGTTGKKFNGKDTIADYIVEKYGFIKISFAEPLKQVSKILFNFSDDQLYGNLKEHDDNYWKVTPRLVFQWLGTDIIRDKMKEIVPWVHNNFWIEHMKMSINNLYKQNKDVKIIISDVRFINEANLIKNYNNFVNVVIKVHRDSVNNNIDNHISETNIDLINNFDYLVVNNSSLQDLYDITDNIMNDVITKNNIRIFIHNEMCFCYNASNIIFNYI